MSTTITDARCPQCGSTDLCIEVKTWSNFADGRPSGFDEEDNDSVEVLTDGEAICRDCNHHAATSTFLPATETA